MTNQIKLFLAGALLAGCAPVSQHPNFVPPPPCCPQGEYIVQWYKDGKPCPPPPQYCPPGCCPYAEPGVSVSVPGLEIQVDGVPGVEVDVSL